jgi:hypothetical protein
VNAARARLEAHRAELVARADADRRGLSAQLAGLGALEDGVGQFGLVKPQLPGLAMGASLGLSALLLALPPGQATVLRAGFAVFRLANSVRKLFTHR